MEDLSKIEEQIQTFRKGGISIARFGFADAKGGVIFKSDTVCYASARSVPKRAKYFFLAWNGDPAVILEKSQGLFYDRSHPPDNRSSFLPGPFSDAWLEFILSPQHSPWMAILPHLVSSDPKVVRESGIIIRDPSAINWGLYYNFIIATRYAYEFSHRVFFWKELVEQHGVDPRAAYLISIGYAKAGNDQVKPKVRKVLVSPAGYRKNAGGFRYIRDEYGDKKFFPAEYKEVDDFPDWKPGVWNGELKELTGCNHSPLSTIYQYSKRVLTADPKEKKYDQAWHSYAWDIFKTVDEPVCRAKTLQGVLEFFQNLTKDKN